METELNRIPKEDYKTIEANSFSLNISNISDIINGFDYDFLTKHYQRRKLLENDPKRIKIEKENREFLKKYWKVYKLITYWYGYYLNEGIGGEKNMKEASDLFKQTADKNVPGAQLRYAFLLLKKNISKNDNEEFIKYLTQAADNVGFQVDEEKGKKYLRLAANKGYKDAIALFNTLSNLLNLFDYSDFNTKNPFIDNPDISVDCSPCLNLTLEDEISDKTKSLINEILKSWPEHPTYCSLECKNHFFKSSINDDREISDNQIFDQFSLENRQSSDLEKSEGVIISNKKYRKKVVVAISYRIYKGINEKREKNYGYIYPILGEVKLPGVNGENDYKKNIRSLNDNFNTIIKYYSKNVKKMKISKKLCERY
ncbi:25262_t:CDS:2 [Gigaspora rosea]|nr:25262_t:CDS:2 [Gigaspora rosea]